MANKHHKSNPVVLPEGLEPGTAPADLIEALGAPISPDLLIHSLTHRSFSHEHEGMPNYERLEFLGDAVLELVTTETLFTRHPDFSEGQMAKMRAKAVSEESLSAIARSKLNLGQYVLLGHGEAESGGADKDSILCDLVESLIGAVFVEHGIDTARKVVHRLIDETLAQVTQAGPALDWKTSLTVKAHELHMPEPRYQMEVSGPEYRLEFTAHVMAVLHKGEEETEIASATGTSKRKAQLAAAEKAWHVLDSRRHTTHTKHKD
ncbi:ribonuclease III [Bifidobacterium simiarum]|uniref:Ribonuclease 3 n=1 Tax=Bifidobacterium simiarum TaxID=2045441 RepID=A0A2M9HG19_9BIFI|nr:ribonuclease III [Bifidobacterium simiarum]PJM75723.1 ribonuclease III [Bifidobacterium simiarum]